MTDFSTTVRNFAIYQMISEWHSLDPKISFRAEFFLQEQDIAYKSEGSSNNLHQSSLEK